MRRIACLALMVPLFVACPGDDEPPDICPAIPFDCADACCTNIVPGNYIDCAQVCPGGFRAVLPSDMCRPDPSCPALPDGGPDSSRPDSSRPDAIMGCPDLPLPSCFGGPCCDIVETAFQDPFTCEAFCPSGLSFECEPSRLCSGGSRCSEPSECTITPVGCCAPCTEPTLEDVIGLASEDVDEYREVVCADPVACPDCEPAAPNPNIVATCNARACIAIDVATLPATLCSDDDECRVRTNTCCECDAEPVFQNLIGITPLGVLDLLNLVCDADATCDACTPTYPDDVEAFCNDGRCDVRRR